MTAYNGIIQIEVNHLANLMEVNRVKQEAEELSQTTRDTTPIISGVITAALASGQYVEVVINGKTYTSEPGGAVVVDPAHNTWYVQLPDTDALTVSATAYTVTAQVKSSAGNGNNANISNGTVTVPELSKLRASRGLAFIHQG